MRIGQDRGWAKLEWGVYKNGKQSPLKVRLSWIIASRFAVVHSISLRKLTFTLLRATSAFLHFVQSAPSQETWHLVTFLSAECKIRFVQFEIYFSTSFRPPWFSVGSTIGQWKSSIIWHPNKNFNILVLRLLLELTYMNFVNFCKS